jgi:hypothetical protein
VIFWVIALAMAGWLVVVVSTGEIRGRRQVLLVSRRTNPVHYWFCVAGIAIVVLGTIVQAISPPY